MELKSSINRGMQTSVSDADVGKVRPLLSTLHAHAHAHAGDDVRCRRYSN